MSLFTERYRDTLDVVTLSLCVNYMRDYKAQIMKTTCHILLYKYFIGLHNY